MVLTPAFNGAGDTWTPTVINLFVFWLWEIPLAWWLSTRTDLGARGVFRALTIAYSTLAVVSAVGSGAGRGRRAASSRLLYLSAEISGSPVLELPTTTTLELELRASSTVASMPFHASSFSLIPSVTMF